MAEQTNGVDAKPIVPMVERSIIIRKQLVIFQKKCLKQINEIPFDEVMGFIEYMSDHLAADENNLFEDSFIGSLKIMVLIAREQTKDFCDNFDEITQLLCDLCPKIDLKVTFFNRVLKYWQELLKYATKRQKYTACLCCASYFKKCAQCLARASSASVQHKLLDIMHEYFKTNSKQPLKWFGELFEHIDIIKNDMINYIDIDYDSFDQKQLMMLRFNVLLENPTIFTEVVEIITIGKEVIMFPGDNGFVYLNKPSKSIEFWLPFKDVLLLATIQAMNIEWIQIVDHRTGFAMELTFKLNSSLRFETKDGNKVHPPELRSNQIKLIFSSGFLTKKVQPLFSEMFNKQAEIISNNDDQDNSNSDVDSDLEIVSVDFLEKDKSLVKDQEYGFSERKRSRRLCTKRNDVVELIDETENESPKKKVSKVNQSVAVKLKEETKAVRKPLKRQNKVQSEEVFDLSDEGPKKKTFNVDHQIPTTSFYSKPEAMQNDDVVEVSVDDSTSKKKTKRQNLQSKAPRKTSNTKALRKTASVPRSPLKKQMPTQSHKILNETIEVKPKRNMSLENNNLTGGSFRSTFKTDAAMSNQRAFDNMNKINENVRRSENVSFSYRTASSSRKPATAISENVSNDSDNENVNGKANAKMCICEKVDSTIEDLKTIRKLANRALTDLDPNSVKCQCDTVKAEDSN